MVHLQNLDDEWKHFSSFPPSNLNIEKKTLHLDLNSTLVGLNINYDLEHFEGH